MGNDLFTALRVAQKEVMTEYLIDNGKRIDIMLQSPALSVPTEVKIDARDRHR